jgi:DNA-binding beta-propeller fold protein YncE
MMRVECRLQREVSDAMRSRRDLLALVVLSTFATAVEWAQMPVSPHFSTALMSAPAGVRPTVINPSAETVLPNGRLITPAGTQVRVAPHPYGLTLSPDGKTLVTVNSGTKPFSVSIIAGLDNARPKTVQIPPGFDSSDADPESVFMGAAIAPDNRTLYVSEGDNGKIGTFDLVTQQRLGGLSLDGAYFGATYKGSLTGALRLTPDGERLLVLDLAHFRMVIFNTQSKQVVASVPVGRLPFGLAVSPDGNRAYVSNVGMFQYSLVSGYDPKNPRKTGLEFPAFGFPSPEAEKGTALKGKRIAGLGDPNVPDSNSVFVIDIHDPARPSVLAKIRTGIPVGDKSAGGSSPGDVVAGKHKVFVSNSTQDSISVLDARTNQIKKTVVMKLADVVEGLRGLLPFGMALSADEKRLYVACAGINAVAVLDARKAKLMEYIPTAWFPARVAVSTDSRTLYVANSKGFGAGPNGGPDFHAGAEGTYIGDLMKGTVSIIPLLSRGGFSSPISRAADAGHVAANNGFFPSNAQGAGSNADSPVPPPGQPSAKIRHVVFIVKENRTFDEVFGDLYPQSSQFAGDPSLARWGETAEVKEKDAPTIADGHVTPNHHALARRFAVSDNYYVDGDVSVDGHHWLVGNYPNELLETAVPAGYGGHFSFQPDDDVPGRLTIGSTHPFPEDYLEAGSLWEQLSRAHISFRNYGEGLEIAGEDESIGEQPTGVREATNMPMPEALFENTSHDYATFNTNISDQYRFGQFEREFQIRYASGKESLPQFVFIWLPNDHTSDPRPADGYAYRASYVADNDLALGKLVQLFSHSPFWKDMAIFVTEDDAQDGRDHVDAHRSVLMVISPYAQRGYVSHTHTSIVSILKTFDLILNMGYLNQFDAAATGLADFFTGQPDLAPYDALPSDTRIFDPAKVQEPGLDLKARHSAPLDDPIVIRREMRAHDRN